ncbi:ATP-binding protein [Cryomorpha ignava]|uniref:ATP-binding protein n=1 Tax=Cryomorpha ignava TaxID=101383 RepID=A0A7K3WTT3_9FLAO|nr:ATP-binding protein [Cryomorpha ignava]NEN24896.1 ATP-binding protein [Cryomorpha ignava]
MDYIVKRSIEKDVLKSLVPNKVVILLGPRRVGKTVLIHQILQQMSEPYLLLNGENADVRKKLEYRSTQNYLNLLGSNKLLVIDEAQKIPEIGNVLKLMVDEIEGLKVLVTGSSAFDINTITGEPLTGRKKTFKLFALSEEELNQVESPLDKAANLNQRLIYGSYPELIQLPDIKEKQEYLEDLVNSYLLKDILSFENIRNSDKIFDLLRLIAFQIGSEVSYNEIGRQLSMSKNTVERYLDLLSKVYILHSVSAFSRNLRKEIVKGKKWYFYDNGLRNILIGNMNPIELRNDIGALWENYIISERIKYQKYSRLLVYNFFWRTYDQQEIDWIEDRGGILHGYEFKWNPKRNAKAPIAWKNAYPDSKFELINSENYLDWVMDGSAK